MTPPEVNEVATPLVSHAWEATLTYHPDRVFTQYIMDGLHQGLRIGCQHKGPSQISHGQHAIDPGTLRGHPRVH